MIAFDTKYKNDRNYAAELSVSNAIITMVDGMTCDDFFLTTDNGIIQKDDRNCMWHYIPHKPNYGMIYFNKIVDGDTVIFHKKRLQILLVEFVPTFGPSLSEKKETIYLTKEQFMESSLSMYVRDSFYREKVMLSSVEVRVRRNDEYLFSKRINEVTQEIYAKNVKKFRKLEPGDIVIFTNIKYEYPNKNGEPFVFETYDIQVVIK